jgi:hypothetical protein
MPLLAVSLTSCQPAGPRVLVLGDSLTVEVKASQKAVHWMTPAGASIDWSGSLFMSAPCNGLAALAKLNYVPDVVIVNYSGNNGSFTDNCMAGETGTALVNRYLADYGKIGQRVHNGHTRLVIVGAPARKPILADSNAVFTALQKWAGQHHLPFVDGGEYITPGRKLSRTAACLKRETGAACGSAGPGRNIIRDPQEEHLCAGDITIVGTCGVYSSGAVRLGIMLGQAITVAKVPGT